MPGMSVQRSLSLAEAASNEIRQAILGGELRAGTRLVEMDLVNQLGISRTPLRQALKTLEAEGLVRSAPNRRTFVATPTPDEYVEMAFIRGALEGAAAGVIANRRDPAVLRRLADATGAVEAAEKAEPGRLVQCCWHFHEAICAGCGNPRLLVEWRRLANVMRLLGADVGVSDSPTAFTTILLGMLRDGAGEEAERFLRRRLLEAAYGAVERPMPKDLEG